MSGNLNVKEILGRPAAVELFSVLYGGNPQTISRQVKRYRRIISNYQHHFNYAGDIQLFSSPGRTEIGGNHTDHNHGKVLAAAINLDSVAAAAKTDQNTIQIFSEGYPQPFVVSLDELNPKKEEAGTTSALIRGIAARFKELGYSIGGFNAFISSDVMVGSGLSSSASIEMLIGTILNAFYNNEQVSPKILAIIGQYAENVYFNKPCGLMDQIACALGGIMTIDFKNPAEPQIKKVDFNFSNKNYSLVIVNTGGNHVDLTEDYASVPSEMKAVAAAFKADVCREITLADVLSNIKKLRSAVGDRAIMRAIHFFAENERIDAQVRSLEKGKFKTFLSLVNDSGNSSFKWLQNCYTTKNIFMQGISLALCLTEDYLKKNGPGACRVHGGGFAGTIQVFLPEKFLTGYQKIMQSVFGNRSVLRLNIRSQGTIHLNNFLEAS